MVLGAITCPSEFKSQIYEDIREIKIKHGISSRLEIKWTKVSIEIINFYTELLEFFFNNDHLTFRGLVAKEKKSLNHSKYNDGKYDDWYYKIYFTLLDTLIEASDKYRVFIDIKDTRGYDVVLKCEEEIKFVQLKTVMRSSKSTSWEIHNNLIENPIRSFYL